MERIRSKILDLRYVRLLTTALLLVIGLLYFSKAYGAELPLRSLLIADSETGAVTTYKLGFDIPGSETLGSIKLQFCSNSPLTGDICNVPAGLDVASANLTSQTGEIGFSIFSGGSNTNTIVLTRTPSVASGGSVTYTFNGAVNPSTEGTYYARVQTFASADASGAENEHGGMALSINAQVQVSTYVPPYLLFCVAVTISPFDCSTASGDYVNFGNLNKSSTSSATTQMLTATNAGNGFNVSVNGTTMVSGTNVIPGISAPDVSRPGTAQFGMNLVGNTTPSVGSDPVGSGNASPASGYNTSNFYKFVSGDIVATDTDTDAYRLFTSSYIVNIPNGQPVGVYVATLTYICLANF